MTLDLDAPAPRRSRLRLRFAPDQGWFALLLVAAMCLALAWALDDAVLVMGEGRVTDFLTWTAIGGVLIGVIGPTVGWGRWTTHLIGAAFAALVTPLLVGSVLLEKDGGGAPYALFQATTHSAVRAWSDLVVNQLQSTFQYGHHLLVLGLLVWGSSQFASFAAFGHRRPLNAVIVIGLLLLGNMSLTGRDQLLYLVLFSVAALFLLVRFHTFDEQSDWLRRRIGDPSAISGLYLRGGTVFIGAAVMGSLLLTNIAASAPLAGAWTDVGGRLLEWSRAIERFLPSGSGRPIGPSFGPNAVTRGQWITDDTPILTIEISAAEEQVPYFAAVVYDNYVGTGWNRPEPVPAPRQAGEVLLAGTADEIPPEGRRELTLTVTPLASRPEVLMPTMPLSVDTPTGVLLIGEGGGYFEGLVRQPSKTPYKVTALVPASEREGGPTQAKLRAAGLDYPEEITALYGPDTIAADALGDASRALLADIRTAAGPQATPYDLTAATLEILTDTTRFTYDPDVRDQLSACGEMSTVECFARIKRGYCEFYASTMAVLLREMGVPTRYVSGFLGGRRDLGAGTSTVRLSDSHAWVQVYFPGYGWIDFDPTGAVATLEPLPSGRPDASASARPSGSTAPVTRRPESEDPRDPLGGTTGGGNPTPGSAGPLIAVSILLAIVVAAIAAVAWQRGPRGPISAEGTYGSVTRLASRFGFAPRPNQTVYEYAGALADVLPNVRPELETVARAKVEVAYGGRILGDDRMRSLREAHRRLRIGLLRLLARRVRRRRPRNRNR